MVTKRSSKTAQLTRSQLGADVVEAKLLVHVIIVKSKNPAS